MTAVADCPFSSLRVLLGPGLCFCVREEFVGQAAGHLSEVSRPFFSFPLACTATVYAFGYGDCRMYRSGAVSMERSLHERRRAWRRGRGRGRRRLEVQEQGAGAGGT